MVWLGLGKPTKSGKWPPVTRTEPTTGDPCPQAATVLTSSESDNPDSPHYADQTELFSRRQWVTAAFCPAQVAADAVSTTVVSGG
jgi:acyl-homoserine-lactone acylase